MKTVADEQNAPGTERLQHLGYSLYARPRVATLVFEQNRVDRDAAIDEIPLGRLRLRELVARRAPPGDDDHRRITGREELDCPIKARLKDGARPPVVLGGAQDHDGVDRASLV